MVSSSGKILIVVDGVGHSILEESNNELDITCIYLYPPIRFIFSKLSCKKSLLGYIVLYRCCVFV